MALACAAPLHYAARVSDQMDADAVAERLRSALRGVALPVTVVLVDDDQEVRGATVSSFMPLSLQPPLVALAIGKGRWLHEPLGTQRSFTVNVLAAGAEHVADHFSSRTDRATGVQQVRLGRTGGGLPTCEGAAVVLVCQVQATLDVGDHSLLVAHVTDVVGAEHEPAQWDPLLWRAGRHTYLER